MKRADYERMKNNSIRNNNNSEKREAYYRGYENGYNKGFKKGALLAMATAAVLTAGYLGYGFLTSPNVPNPTLVAANQSFTENSQTKLDTLENWVDFQEVAEDYDPETMDFDIYIYTIYSRLNYVDDNTRIKDMNQLFRQLNLIGKSEYDNFVSYCKDRGLCIETDEGYKVDEKRYCQALKDYTGAYHEKLVTEQKIDEIKGGMHQWKV